MIALTDENADVMERYSYDVFGEADSLVFLRARYYDSRVGRFISRDPRLSPEYYIKFQSQVGISAMRSILQSLLMKPQNLNPYVYTINNPVNLIDPRGGCSKVKINGLCFLWCVAKEGTNPYLCALCVHDCFSECQETCTPKPGCYEGCNKAALVAFTACENCED